MKDKIQEPIIERGITRLRIPHKKGECVTAWPSYGPGNYQKVGKEILDSDHNLRLQTGYETSLLVNKVYGRKEHEFQDVKDKVKNNYLWVYQVDFWIPEKDKNSGMYSVHDSKAVGRNMKFNQEELEEMLKGAEVYQGVRINRDNGIAFAPRSTIYLGKETDWNKFARNGENIAIFYPEGAENLAELGKNHFKHGHNWGISGNDNVETRVSALGDNSDLGDGLVVYGDWGGGNGVAFGVCNSEKKE